MSLTRRQLIQRVKIDLRISDETIHTTTDLNSAVAQTLIDISNREPLEAKIGVPFVEYTKDIDLANFNRPPMIEIDDCDVAWTAKTNVTSTADPNIKMEGTASSKNVIATAFTTGLVATHDFTAKDLSSYEKIKFWVMSNATLTKGVLQYVLDDTAACASPLEYIDIPALVANVWTEVEADLSNPSALTAIISNGLYAYSDPGAISVYMDDIVGEGLTQAAILNVHKVEYPTDLSTTGEPQYYGFEEFGDTLSVGINTVPTITDGTLTGTITFTNGSRAVTGSGSLFTTELDEDYFICTSTGSRWYKIASVTSATALILEQIFEEATLTDTVSVTKYRDNDSCAYLHCGREYTLTDYYSNVPPKMDNVLVLGTTAYAAQAWTGEYIQSLATASVTKIASAVTVLEDIAARITLANSDLVTGLALINTANVGGTQAAQAYTQYNRAELDTAATIINHATNYLNQVAQELNVSEIVARYRNWADAKMTEYKTALRKLGKIRTYQSYPR